MRMFWRIYLSYMAIIAIVVVAVVWYVGYSQKQFYLAQTEDDLRWRTRNVEFMLSQEDSDQIGISNVCRQLGLRSETRFTVIGPDGAVWGDSNEEPEMMDNHAGRPEVSSALAGRSEAVVRFSSTLQKSMMYVAVPSYKDGKIIRVVRGAVSVSFIDDSLTVMRNRIILAGLMAIIIAAPIGYFLSRRISRPLEILTSRAGEYAAGQLDQRLISFGTVEIDDLSKTMNLMAGRLKERIDAIGRHDRQQKAIMESMVEAVIAVDADEKIISLNRAVFDFFNIADDDPGSESIIGRPVYEVIRNTIFQEMIAEILDKGENLEADIVVGQTLPQRYLRASGSAIKSVTGGMNNVMGAVVVLSDVTRMRQLANVRRDFVANVSHELKTPITSIKGFVETLQHGAIDNRDDTARFLEIIARQADRLNEITDDLLTISSLEKAPDVSFEKVELGTVIKLAFSGCRVLAEAKNIKLKLEMDTEFSIIANGRLIEQALINLIENGIKYSESGSEIVLVVRSDDMGVKITVVDQGCGISVSHLSRLFERFYRVDNARSRELGGVGGTGLGLAIVKHIALVHGGSVGVESEVGVGSRFFISLPAYPPGFKEG